MRRRLEQEISDLKDQLAERDGTIADLQSALTKRDEELSQALSSGDDSSQKLVCVLVYNLLMQSITILCKQ